MRQEVEERLYREGEGEAKGRRGGTNAQGRE